MAKFLTAFFGGLVTALPWAIGLVWAAYAWGHLDGMSFWLRAPISAAAFFLGRVLTFVAFFGLTIVGSLVYVSISKLIEKVRGLPPT